MNESFQVLSFLPTVGSLGLFCCSQICAVLEADYMRTQKISLWVTMSVLVTIKNTMIVVSWVFCGKAEQLRRTGVYFVTCNFVKAKLSTREEIFNIHVGFFSLSNILSSA